MKDESSLPITMTCMTTKKKFEVLRPEVTVLKNGRYAFRADCPWEGKNGKKLIAFKFCSLADYEAQCARQKESEHFEKEESEQNSDTEIE